MSEPINPAEKRIAHGQSKHEQGADRIAENQGTSYKKTPGPDDAEPR